MRAWRAVATATIAVNLRPTTPRSPTRRPTRTQSSSGLVIDRNAVDSSEVGFFKITNITNGKLYLANGTTEVVNGDFLAYVDANAGLKFTPNAGYFGSGTFNVQASLSSSDTGLGGAVKTATIAVNAVADTPSVTDAATDSDLQTTSGLAITLNAQDGAEVGFFKITNITHGSLFQNDGTTPINAGDFITVGQGNTGLKFTPAAGFFGMGTFDVQASLSNADTGLGAGVTAHRVTAAL